MPPSPRYTVRLPHALDAQVQARVSAGTPFAVLIREALAAYLTDTPPTEAPIPADSADTARTLQEQLAALTTRVEILEQRPTRRRQHAARDADRTARDADRTADTHADSPVVSADSPLTGADTSRRAAPGAALTQGGQHKLTPRQAAALRAKRQRGAPIKALMEEYDLSRATVHRYLAAAPGG